MPPGAAEQQGNPSHAWLSEQRRPRFFVFLTCGNSLHSPANEQISPHKPASTRATEALFREQSSPRYCSYGAIKR